MSGGIAYLFEPDQENINTQMVYVERVTYDDKKILHFQISEHVRLTGSKRGQAFLADWEAHANKFTKVDKL
jgi:Glutamate synthase domain 3